MLSHAASFRPERQVDAAMTFSRPAAASTSRLRRNRSNPRYLQAQPAETRRRNRTPGRRRRRRGGPIKERREAERPVRRTELPSSCCWAA